jgi:transposase-like protein
VVNKLCLVLNKVDTKKGQDMKKNQRKYYRYSTSFKEKIMQEISEGRSISEVNRRYGIKGTGTIRYWLKKYGRTDLLSTEIVVRMRSEKDRIKQLEDENKRLKIALADATLAKDVLETLVEVVDEHYQTDVKKNFGQELLSDAVKRKVRK